MNFNSTDFDKKILKISQTIALTTFFILMLFRTFNHFNISNSTITIVSATLSALSIMLSLYATSGAISASLMLNSVIMMLYVSSLYWNVFTGYKFFASLLLLIILLLSLYKILKNK